MPVSLRTYATHFGRLLAFAALVLALAAAPAIADTPARQDCGPSLPMLGPDSLDAVVFGAVAMAKGDGSIDGPGALSDCTADCKNGTSVNCTGSSCSAYDRDCSSGEQGHCTGSDSGIKYCSQACQICQDPTLCSEKQGSPCSGQNSGSDCTSSVGSCGSCICRFGSWMCGS